MRRDAQLMLKNVGELRDQVLSGAFHKDKSRVMAVVARSWLDTVRLQLKYQGLRENGAIPKIAFCEGGIATKGDVETIQQIEGALRDINKRLARRRQSAAD